MSRDAFDRFTSKVPSWAYEIVAPGYKYNLTDLAAAMGIEQLKKVERFAAQRSRIAAAYHEAFADLPLILPAMPVGGDLHPWHLYSIRLGDEAVAGESAPGEARAQFIANMFEQGVGCSVHYIPLHQHPYWRERYALQASDFPHSQRAYERLVSLPIYSRMGEAEVQRVVGAVRRALDRR
jgi:dTDP-4-amino-4,6-dideoxygalactose transaminase